MLRQESDNAVHHAPVGADGSGPSGGAYGSAFHLQSWFARHGLDPMLNKSRVLTIVQRSDIIRGCLHGHFIDRWVGGGVPLLQHWGTVAVPECCWH